MYVNDRLIDALLPKLPLLDRVSSDELLGPGGPAGAISERAHPLDLIRKCVLDGSALGMTAIIIEPCELSGYERRWLDLCAKCHHDVLDLAEHWPGDDYIQSRLHLLRNAALLGA